MLPQISQHMMPPESAAYFCLHTSAGDGAQRCMLALLTCPTVTMHLISLSAAAFRSCPVRPPTQPAGQLGPFLTTQKEEVNSGFAATPLSRV